MKILMLLPRLPLPLNRGDRIRSFHELTYLARRHQLWCACLIDEPPQPHHLAAVAQHCQGLASLAVARPVRAARSLIAVATGRTFTQAYFACPTLHKTVARWARTVRFDAVLAFSSAMAELAEALPARRRVLDLVDVDSQKWADYARMAGWPASALYAREARQLLQRELAWLQRFDATVVVCRREAALLSAASAATRLHVVPNGADLPPQPPASAALTGPIVGFVGSMNYWPNIDAVTWFARAIWPALRQRAPQAQWRIVGRSPSRPVRRLARLAGVTVVGDVPQMHRHLSQVRLCVAPLRIARGVQNKVLQAMAAARPVVATPQVAAGLDAKPGQHLLVACNEDEFVGAVLSLLRDRLLADQIGRAARDFVARHYRWDRSLRQLEALLDGSCQRPEDHPSTPGHSRPAALTPMASSRSYKVR